MKRLFYLMTGILALFIIVGCASNEKKAEKLIDDYMFKHLHDYKSYEPVETTIDTLYNTPFTDDDCVQAASQIDFHAQKADKYREEAESAERKMNIWSGGWSSTSRSEYLKAAHDFYEAKMNELIESREGIKNTKIILEKLPELDGKTQVGWIVNHSYRCNNRGGNSMLASRAFLMDKKFKTILNSYDTDDDATLRMLALLQVSKESYTPEQLDALIERYDGTIAQYKERVDALE